MNGVISLHVSATAAVMSRRRLELTTGTNAGPNHQLLMVLVLSSWYLIITTTDAVPHLTSKYLLRHSPAPV